MGVKNPHPEHPEKTMLIVPASCPAENPPYGFSGHNATIENTGENYHNAAKSVNPFERISKTHFPQNPHFAAHMPNVIIMRCECHRECHDERHNPLQSR